MAHSCKKVSFETTVYPRHEVLFEEIRVFFTDVAKRCFLEEAVTKSLEGKKVKVLTKDEERPKFSTFSINARNNRHLGIWRKSLSCDDISTLQLGVKRNVRNVFVAWQDFAVVENSHRLFTHKITSFFAVAMRGLDGRGNVSHLGLAHFMSPDHGTTLKNALSEIVGKVDSVLEIFIVGGKKNSKEIGERILSVVKTFRESAKCKIVVVNNCVGLANSKIRGKRKVTIEWLGFDDKCNVCAVIDVIRLIGKTEPSKLLQ